MNPSVRRPPAWRPVTPGQRPAAYYPGLPIYRFRSTTGLSCSWRGIQEPSEMGHIALLVRS